MLNLQNHHKQCVYALNLAVNRVPGELVAGHQILDMRENLWLHTTSILVSLLMLRDEYRNVGVVSPSYHGFALPEQKKRVAKGLGACNPQNQRVIGAMNLNLHWVAFLVDNKKRICFMFDPLQSDANYTTIETSVRAVVEKILGLEDMLHYERITWCTQQDSSSCGVWSIAILEMLLSGAIWNDCVYNLVPYLRMRLLYKAIAFIERESVVIDV